MKLNLTKINKQILACWLFCISLIAGSCANNPTFDQRLLQLQEESFLSWMHEPVADHPNTPPTISSSELMETVRHLVEFNLDSVSGKANYQHYLDSVGTSLTATHRWQEFFMVRQNGDSLSGKNWICQTETGSKPIWMVTAHYDVVARSPGADDNASGVAAMLAIAEALQAGVPDKELWFVAFDQEETGLHGSYHFLASLGADVKDRISGVVNLDMIGYTSQMPNSQLVPEGFELIFPELVTAILGQESKADFAIAAGNYASRKLMASLVNDLPQASPELRVAFMLLPNSGKDVETLRASDHAHFWDAQLPTIYLGDGADTRNAHYHSEQDQLSDLDPQHMASVTAWLEYTMRGNTLHELASK